MKVTDVFYFTHLPRSSLPTEPIIFTKFDGAYPQGRHLAPLKVKFGTGKRTFSSVPNFTFIGSEMWNTANKTVKMWNFAQRLVCTIFMKFSAFIRVYR